MEPQLVELQTQFEKIGADAAALADGLSNAQMTWVPRLGVWSIALNFSHLNAVDGQDIPAIFRAIQSGRQENRLAGGPFQWGMLESWFIRSMEPPPKRKFKAPKVYEPGQQFNAKEMVLEFQRLQNDLSFILKKADGLDLKKIKIASPVSKWIKMSLGARFHLIAAHDRRHLYQAWQVRKSPGFPAT